MISDTNIGLDGSGAHYDYVGPSVDYYSSVSQKSAPQHEYTGLDIKAMRKKSRSEKLQRGVMILISVVVIIILVFVVVTTVQHNLPVGSGSHMTDIGSSTSPEASNQQVGIPSECLSATNLTQWWRKDHNGSEITPDGNPNCDSHNMYYGGRPWFRFTGEAGTRLRNTCPPPSSCGTHGAIWSDEQMPGKVGLLRVVNAYGSWAQGCKDFTYRISVMRCSPAINDYVYRHEGDFLCARGFCGMD